MKERSMQELMQLLENISDNKLPTIDKEMDSYFGSKPGVLEEEETLSLEEVATLVMNIGDFTKKLKENMDNNFEALADLLKTQSEFIQKSDDQINNLETLATQLYSFDERIKNLEELLSSDRTIN
jgi:methyl-accepting chemotaxis protein